jgi:hypothetical protein
MPPPKVEKYGRAKFFSVGNAPANGGGALPLISSSAFSGRT